MKVLRNILIAVLILLGLTYAYGASLSKTHLASASIELKQSPQAVFDLIAAIADYPSWRTGVQAARVESGPGKYSMGVEEIEHWGAVRYEIIEHQPPTRMVTRIVDEGQGWGGSWTFEIIATQSGARLRITEDGRVDGALMRVLAKHVFGFDHTLKQYLSDVARHFGEVVAPGA